MSQNPLDNIRKRPAATRRSFPNPLYEQDVLKPARDNVADDVRAAIVTTHQARLVDLVEVRAIEREHARETAQVLAGEVPAAMPGMLPFEDIERVINQTAGGRALLGTAPEEVQATAFRLVLRSRTFDLLHSLVSLRATTARLALGHLTTAVTVTSNGQMVQPTTLGHYFTSALGPIERTTSRLREAYARLNRSPLGSVSGMSTAIPVRRERLAALLGFDGLVEHTFDALAAADVEHELVSIVAGCSLELLRVSHDLAEWARDDVGTIVPSEEFVHGGGAQPQRRDPLVLEHLRIGLQDLISALPELGMLLSGRTMLQGTVTRQRLFQRAERSLTGLTQSCDLLTAVLGSLEVNRALTANRAHKGFATSSELADLLAIDCELPRDQAYELAERIATEAMVLALGGMQLDTKLVDRLALEVIGREVGIEPETLGKCLSVKRFVERRDVPGGPAPSAVRALIEQEHVARRQLEDWIADQQRTLDRAEEELVAAISGL